MLTLAPRNELVGSKELDFESIRGSKYVVRINWSVVW
jgi:hypothetical protein